MPFKSEKQRKWMWANEPEIAQKWADEEKRSKKKKKTHSSTSRRLIQSNTSETQE